MFRAELHCHSTYSADGHVSPKEIIYLCRRQRLDLIALTDHNEIKGAVELQSLAPSWLTVVVGEEISTRQGDVIGLYLKKRIQPNQSLAATIAQIKSQGGLVMLPHPFDRWRREAIGPAVDAVVDRIDAVETFNSRCISRRDNQRAGQWSLQHRVPAFVGSDAHLGIEFGRSVVLLPALPRSPQGLIRLLKKAELRVRKTSPLIHIVTWWKKRWPSVLAGLFGLAVYLLLGGSRLINPSNIDNLLSGDLSMNLFGWLHFQREALQFPLGHISDYLHPYGTTIAYTDSIPVVAWLWRGLSQLWPALRQYFGLWSAVQFGLLGYVSAQMMGRFGARGLVKFMAGSLLTVSSAMINQIYHPSLLTHWTILLLLFWHFWPRDDARAIRRRLKGATAMVLASVFIHPYLTAMLFVLATSYYVTIGLYGRRIIPKKEVTLYWLVTLVGTLAMFWLAGYFSGSGNLGAGGYAGYAADLSTFLVPYRSISNIEGSMYLGAGVLGAGVLACILALRRRPQSINLKHLWPLLVAVGAMAVFAFGPSPSWLGQPLFRASGWYEPIAAGLLTSFRTIGRFVWPLGYLLAIGSIGGLIYVWRQRPVATALVFVILLAVQVGERSWSPIIRLVETDVRSSELWTVAQNSGYRHVEIYPLAINSGYASCGYYNRQHEELIYFAYQYGMTVNSGYTARGQLGLRDACRQQSSRVMSGLFDSRTIYIVLPGVDYTPFTAAGATCGLVDHDRVCVRPDHADSFTAALSAEEER